MAKVVAVAEIGQLSAINVANEAQNYLSNQDEETSNAYFDSQKVKSERNAMLRNDVFESILQNQLTTISFIEHFVYPFIIILISSSILIPFCLFPGHDLVLQPEYWYESLYHAIYYAIAHNLMWAYMAGYYLNMTYFHHAGPLVIVSLAAIIIAVLVIPSSYFIWTRILHYHYPIPFCGIISTVLLAFIYFPTIWYLIPSNYRQYSELKKRMKYFIYFMISIQINVLFYQFLMVTVENFRGPYQPLIALFFPVTREFTIWLFTKMIKNCSNGDARSAFIVMLYHINVFHTINLCYLIGSVTDDNAAWVLMGIDFSANMYLCLRIVWMRNKNPEGTEQQVLELQELALVELVEFCAPLSFIFVTVLAYNTPIGAIAGNVSNGYWAYHAIDDIGITTWKMGFFFFMDFTSAIASATILWLCCNIKLWNAFTALQKEFCKPFISLLGFYLIAVSCEIEIMLI